MNPGTFLLHQRIGRVEAADGAGLEEQLRDEWRGDQRVEMHVQPVEHPAQPGGDAGLPLARREVAQARRLGGWDGWSQQGWHAAVAPPKLVVQLTIVQIKPASLGINRDQFGQTRPVVGWPTFVEQTGQQFV